jgi:S-DNA-T family DNA segregation ATPase FtsK/SpoIIIE
MKNSIFKAPIDLKKHVSLIYAEGVFGLEARKKHPMRAKTADGILRYANSKIPGVIDSTASTRPSLVRPASPSERGERGEGGEVAITDEKEFAIKKTSRLSGDFKLPPVDLLEKETGRPSSGDIVANANIIKRTLQNFGIEVEMGEVNVGPTVTQFTLKPAEGVKLARIMSLNNDLSLALAAHPIRIEAPIPGRSLVGIEIPNKGFSIVRIKNLLESSEFQKNTGNLKITLGRDVAGSPIIANLAKMPHLLIAGSTGSGKTICLNIIILSLLYQNPPNLLKFILIDPKRVEFPVFADIPHLLAPVVVDTQKTVNALKWAVSEMERRFELLASFKARDIGSFNSSKKIIEQHGPLSYIVIVIDELADLMASRGKEIEALVVRLAQMARAVGIHLVLATQRPSVEVITGLIKANITSRIAFQVASQIDSRTVLDMGGAEKLLGNGDMLYLSGDASKPRRVQGAYITDKEVKRVADYLREEGIKFKDADTELPANINPQSDITEHSSRLDFEDMTDATDDELYEEAHKLVIQAQKASSSLLQRRLRVGYARAARLIDMLEENGVIGPGEGAKPRDVYIGRKEEV